MRYTPVPQTLIDSIKAHLGDAFVKSETVQGQSRVTIKRDAVRKALTFLKTHRDIPFEQLSDVAGADLDQLPGRDDEAGEDRFLIWYLLTSMSKNQRLVLRTTVPEDDAKVESAYVVYKSAAWCEREAWEMFGIDFVGHPDLRRLLTPDYFDENNQHPLRKDYPLKGIGDRYNFPVYDPATELDLTRFGYAGDEHGNPPEGGPPKV
ncbi:MAG: NADH-quinone oxidoreductase subunit C [Planctomycetota bacterium]